LGACIMKKVLIDQDYGDNKHIHFLLPGDNLTICEWQIKTCQKLDNFKVEILDESSKKKVDCSDCISMVELCKSIKKSEYIKLSDFEE
jgi:hypothetical protein